MTIEQQDPDAIRDEIERTRGQLSRDVDTLTESVRPGNVARRTAGRASGRMSRLKDSVMGGADDARSRTGDVASQLGETVQDAPRAARRQTRGNPLAAGAVALAAGWLVGSLLPASDRERDLATTAKDKAEPLLDEARSVGQEAAEHLREPARDAAESVRQTARGASEDVKEHGRSAANELRDKASR
jgi:ElaB/YqjD/DUF883 family membrane-anchored ribosome-binding protein